MKQWQSDAFFKNTKLVGVIANMGTESTFVRYVNFVLNGGFFYQEYKFKVLKGTRGFIRIVNQGEVDGTGSAQNTSTSVVGVLDNLTNYKGHGMSNGGPIGELAE